MSKGKAEGRGARGSWGPAGWRAGRLLWVCRVVCAALESLRPRPSPAPCQAASASPGVRRGGHRQSSWLSPGRKGSDQSSCPCLGPQVANRFVRRTPQPELPQATFHYPQLAPLSVLPPLRTSGAPGAPSLSAAKPGASCTCGVPHSRTPLPQTGPPRAGVGRVLLPNAGRER